MTSPAGQAAPADHPILHAAIAMAPRIHAASGEIERERRLPPSLVKALREAGVFGMATPRVGRPGTRSPDAVPRHRGAGHGRRIEIVQLACKAAGGTAVYQKGPFDRCLRDMLTMNQHVVATLRTYEMAGRLLLALEPLRWLF
jgi:Acyl-CoA dehydrogenase, C-terminal domain